VSQKPRFEGWTCPLPLRNYPSVVLGHGSGGQMMADLIRHLFHPEFGNELLAQMADATVIDLDGARLAFTTDSYVVSPLFFPGGDIGELAVNGTVNDLAMSGAKPLFVSAAFILEEGLPMETLARVAGSVRRACDSAGVKVAAGDTKVVNRGHGDGLYLSMAGLGVVPAGIAIGPERAQPGDVIIVSGPIGDHGMAILSVREGLEFETAIESDTAPLNGLVGEMLAAAKGIHCLRDLTRGGLAAALNELASSSNVGVELEESSVPVRPAVRAACEMLGFDPLYVANEGKLVCFVTEAESEAALSAMRAQPLGAEACRIGVVVADHPGRVVARTSIGGSRLVDLPAGELLPRIC
jgi:hydrogenase expression/formation protein HypE